MIELKYGTILQFLVLYRSGAANQKKHHFLMIFDFETLFLGQKFEFRDNQRPRWIGELLARRSVLGNFCSGAELGKKIQLKSKLLNERGGNIIF